MFFYGKKGGIKIITTESKNADFWRTIKLGELMKREICGDKPYISHFSKNSYRSKRTYLLTHKSYYFLLGFLPIVRKNAFFAVKIINCKQEIFLKIVAVYLLRSKRNLLRSICKYFRVFTDILIELQGRDVKWWQSLYARMKAIFWRTCEKK